MEIKFKYNYFIIDFYQILIKVCQNIINIQNIRGDEMKRLFSAERTLSFEETFLDKKTGKVYAIGEQRP